MAALVRPLRILRAVDDSPTSKISVGLASFLVAYAKWVLFFLIGAMIYVCSGLGIKGTPTSDDGVKFIAYLICIWSPLGLPIVLGAGPVLLWMAWLRSEQL